MARCPVDWGYVGGLVGASQAGVGTHYSQVPRYLLDWAVNNSLIQVQRPRIVELSFNSTGVLVGSWLFCSQEFSCLASSGCLLGVGVEVWTKNVFISVHWEPISFWHAKRCYEFGPQWTDVESYLFPDSTPTPNVRLKLNEHGKFCVQTNQLPKHNSGNTKLWLN